MERLPLPHYNERPASLVDTIVIHSMHAPEDQEPYSPKACIALLDIHQVAPHFIVGREGQLIQCVPENARAWHAGSSKMPFSDDSRENVNDFSIGIELIGSETSGFTDAQYQALEKIIADVASKFPIRAIVGHEHIAPGRKTDPGPLFDWGKLAELTKERYRYPVQV